jgi:hypothetical protein
MHGENVEAANDISGLGTILQWTGGWNKFRPKLTVSRNWALLDNCVWQEHRAWWYQSYIMFTRRHASRDWWRGRKYGVSRGSEKLKGLQGDFVRKCWRHRMQWQNSGWVESVEEARYCVWLWNTGKAFCMRAVMNSTRQMGNTKFGSWTKKLKD